MWTPAARAELARETLPYATCLSDAEFIRIGPWRAFRHEPVKQTGMIPLWETKR